MENVHTYAFIVWLRKGKGEKSNRKRNKQYKIISLNNNKKIAVNNYMIKWKRQKGKFVRLESERKTEKMGRKERKTKKKRKKPLSWETEAQKDKETDRERHKSWYWKVFNEPADL